MLSTKKQQIQTQLSKHTQASQKDKATATETVPVLVNHSTIRIAGPWRITRHKRDVRVCDAGKRKRENTGSDCDEKTQ